MGGGWTGFPASPAPAPLWQMIRISGRRLPSPGCPARIYARERGGGAEGEGRGGADVSLRGGPAPVRRQAPTGLGAELDGAGRCAVGCAVT